MHKLNSRNSRTKVLLTACGLFNVFSQSAPYLTHPNPLSAINSFLRFCLSDSNIGSRFATLPLFHASSWYNLTEMGTVIREILFYFKFFTLNTLYKHLYCILIFNYSRSRTNKLENEERNLRIGVHMFLTQSVTGKVGKQTLSEQENGYIAMVEWKKFVNIVESVT